MGVVTPQSALFNSPPIPSLESCVQALASTSIAAFVGIFLAIVRPSLCESTYRCSLRHKRHWSMQAEQEEKQSGTIGGTLPGSIKTFSASSAPGLKSSPIRAPPLTEVVFFGLASFIFSSSLSP